MSVSVTGATRAAIASLGFFALGALRLNALLMGAEQETPDWLATLLNASRPFESVYWMMGIVWEAQYHYYPLYVMSALHVFLMYMFVVQFDARVAFLLAPSIRKFLDTQRLVIRLALTIAIAIDVYFTAYYISGPYGPGLGKDFAATSTQATNMETLIISSAIGTSWLLIWNSRYAIPLLWLLWLPFGILFYAWKFLQ